MTRREQDEMHLEWLRLHDAGVLHREIARRSGVTIKAVHNLIGRVRKEYAASEAS